MMVLPRYFIHRTCPSFRCNVFPGIITTCVVDCKYGIQFSRMFQAQLLLFLVKLYLTKEVTLHLLRISWQGMAGGEVVVVPYDNCGYVPEEATIVGNTCLYGATGGQLFVRGKAGERFAVRNSMAEAVIEGTGDHCCEYMTGGCVVSLGK